MMIIECNTYTKVGTYIYIHINFLLNNIQIVNKYTNI